nr:InlB B-repeat-containing protein [Lachnospiraceae bacterium]
MKKRALAKRIMTVMLAASMMLSNTATVYATEPTTTQNSQESTGEQTGEDNSQNGSGEENTSTVQNDASAGGSGAGDNSSSESENGTSTETESSEDESGKDADASSGKTDDATDKTSGDNDKILGAEDKDPTDKDALTDKGEGADEEVFELDATEATLRLNTDKLPDNKDLLEGFLDRELEEQIKENKTEVEATTGLLKGKSIAMAAVPRYRAKNLTGNDLVVYNSLKDQILSVADGTLASSQFSIPVKNLNNGKMTYTAQELGYDPTTSEGQAAFQNKFSYDMDTILDALLIDCPYDLYWYDKGKSISYTTTIACSYSSSSISANEDRNINITFKVSADYAENNQPNTTKVDTQITSKVSTTIGNANQVVAEASSLTDYGKLVYYRDWICDNVSYNYSASPTGNYGNPWQVIWVFDGVDETKVVCEGYSKAFKWLCDLSTFSDSRVGAYIVSGTLGQNGKSLGNHMWNNVRMDDGKYYLVDVTNYDDDSNNFDTELFLGGYSRYQSSVYYFNLRNDTLWYVYNDDTVNIYTSDELAISNTAYSSVYSVTFDACGHGTAPATITGKQRGDKIAEPTAPSATGYVFDGWYKESSHINKWRFDTDTVTSNITLYAKWVENWQTITFMSNDGNSTSFTQNVLDNTETALSANSFIYAGHRFTGWNTQTGGDGTSYADRERVKLTSPVTLYAQWELINADAPTITTQPAESLSLTYGDTGNTLRIVASAATTTGYTLSYQWYENNDKNSSNGTSIAGA